MPVLTDLAAAVVKDHVRKIYGQTLSRPALLVTDGVHLTYACDVNIGPTDPTGRIKQYMNDGEWDLDIITGIPGQPPDEYQLGDELTINTVLRNVAIARGNQELIYADVGAPVELTRTYDGKWEITGFSRELPGTYNIIPVSIPPLTLGAVQSNILVPLPQFVTVGPVLNQTIATRLLTLGELGTLRPFGALPFGASGIWVGGVFLRAV